MPDATTYALFVAAALALLLVPGPAVAAISGKD
jgi:threonine/homoserine/homoserine lactone efflux protein